MRQTFAEQLTELVRPEVEGLGYVLWGLTAPSSTGRRVIRIYIDREGGVNVDDCAAVSRQVGLLLDVEDIVPGAFTLEVSSPGLDRRFFFAEQLGDYLGQNLSVGLHEPVDGRRTFKGKLLAVEGSRLTLAWEGGEIALDWPAVKEARLAPEMEGPSTRSS